jgi:hypothetical protein
VSEGREGARRSAWAADHRAARVVELSEIGKLRALHTPRSTILHDQALKTRAKVVTLSP